MRGRVVGVSSVLVVRWRGLRQPAAVETTLPWREVTLYRNSNGSRRLPCNVLSLLDIDVEWSRVHRSKTTGYKSGGWQEREGGIGGTRSCQRASKLPPHDEGMQLDLTESTPTLAITDVTSFQERGIL